MIELQIIIAVLATVIPILITLAGALYWLGKKFAEINEGFKRIDERFKSIDEKFKSIDERFKRIDERFEGVDGRFKGVEERFKGLEERLKRIAEGFMYSQEFMLEVFSYEGLLRAEAVSLIKGELRRIYSMVFGFNSLTKEEKEDLKTLLEKEELNYEEAVRLREIARKLVFEYGGPEAWKLLWYSCVWIGHNLRKMKLERASVKSSS